MLPSRERLATCAARPLRDAHAARAGSLRRIVAGKLNKQIAAALGTAERTIKAHRAQGALLAFPHLRLLPTCTKGQYGYGPRSNCPRSPPGRSLAGFSAGPNDMKFRIGAAGRHISSLVFSAVSRRLSDESFEDLHWTNHGQQSKL
jgi:hypothetical protein